MRHALILLIACVGAARAADDVEALKKRVAELEQEVIELKAGSVPYSVLVKDEDISITCWHLVDGRGTLTTGARALLALSDDEAKAIDAALARARGTVVKAIADQGPKPVIKDGTLTLALGPFAEPGRKAESELRRTVSDLLGRDRAAFFKKLSEHSLKEPFLHFGEASYTFAVTPAGRGFSTKVEHKSAHGSGSSSSSSGQLDGEFELLKPYIPPEFGGTAGAPDTPAPAPEPVAPKTRSDF